MEPGGQASDERVIGVQDGQIIRFLIPEKQGLGVGIGLEISIPFEVIGANVQEGRGVGLKRGCGVELKAADFQD